ncbi:kinase-like domain-containing protein [Chytriomyces sp. MP71]|nr:kinase-like domain-containing protein [Chytriomyces sp. MP71]
MHRFAAIHSPFNTPPASTDSSAVSSVRVSRADTKYFDPSTASLTTEQKARVAIWYALAHTTSLDGFLLNQVVGFGANGVVIAAETTHPDKGTFHPVAIKLIYKPKSKRIPATLTDTPPNEILALRAIGDTSPHPSILRYVSDHQDLQNFYLVTELFGSDWLGLVRDLHMGMGVAPRGALPPLVVKERGVILPFSSGCSDLWAWSYFERTTSWDRGTGKSVLPAALVRTILREICEALAHLHALGMYHGDVKAENVLVNAVDPSSGFKDAVETASSHRYNVSVRLCDFGHTEMIASSMHHIGTVDNAPPEFNKDNLRKGAFLDGAKADVYAMGLLVGKLISSSGLLDDLSDMSMFGLVQDGVQHKSELELFHELLMGMVADDPEERWGMDRVARHPWFFL